MGDYSPLVVHRLLIVVTSLGAGYKGYGMQASLVVIKGLSYPAACGIILDPVSNLCPLHWKADSTTEPPGKVKESEVTQSCPTLCNPMDRSIPGSSVDGIFQPRVAGWVAISFSRGSS